MRLDTLNVRQVVPPPPVHYSVVTNLASKLERKRKNHTMQTVHASKHAAKTDAWQKQNLKVEEAKAQGYTICMVLATLYIQSYIPPSKSDGLIVSGPGAGGSLKSTSQTDSTENITVAAH